MHHPPTGWLFIDLAGVAETSLRAALAGGFAPALATLVAAGYHLTATEPDLAGSAIAGLACILHADDYDIPASRWFERAAGRVLAPDDRPEDAAVVEARIDRGAGLLREGSARGSALRGGARAWTAAPAADALRLARGDLAAQIPAVYVALGAFAPVASGAGPEGEAALRALRALDRDAGGLLAIADARGYTTIVLASHGLGPARPDGALGRAITGIASLAEPGAVVLLEANLALITLPRGHRRLTREELDEHHPGLLARLAGLPGVAFLLVNSSVSGATLIGRDGMVSLDEERVRGVDPLAGCDPGCARHLRRFNLYRTAPDILVVSAHDRGLPRCLSGGRAASGAFAGPAAWPLLLLPEGLSAPGTMVGDDCAIGRRLRGWRRSEGRVGVLDAG